MQIKTNVQKSVESGGEYGGGSRKQIAFFYMFHK